MFRRTKIIATLGPSTDDPKVLDSIAGIDLVRLNFSHQTAEDHRRRIEAIRTYANAYGKEIGIIADLQGPKIRIERFQNGQIFLEEGNPFTLDATLGARGGDFIKFKRH